MSDEPNIALLIDADNASPERLDDVLLVLGELGTINVRRAYGNFAKPGLKRWGELSNMHSIIPVQQFDPTKGKSVTDMRMAIDALDLLHGGRVDGFGIMSSDSDFLPLAQRIREDGLEVYGFGDQKTPISFQNSCTRFFDVTALGSNQADEDAPSAQDVDAELIDVLGAAWKASKRDEEGYASLSEMGQRAKAVSSFSARNFGFQRLGDLVRSLPNFDVKATSEGKQLARRLR